MIQVKFYIESSDATILVPFDNIPTQQTILAKLGVMLDNDIISDEEYSFIIGGFCAMELPVLGACDAVTQPWGPPGHVDGYISLERINDVSELDRKIQTSA